MASEVDDGKCSRGGSPAAITASCHPVAQGQMPPLVSPHRRPGESLLRVGTCLGLLLCHDVGFCLLIDVGLHLICMLWLGEGTR
jgi:hypothetical protein